MTHVRGWLGCMTTLLALALAPGLATPAWAGQTIQPGMAVLMEGAGSGGCTGNFVFDGLGAVAGRTYLGLASHCIRDNAGAVAVDLDGVPIGRVVRHNWPLASIAHDWALIEILPERLGDVDPSQQGNPEFPTGVAGEQDVERGDEVRISGWGTGFTMNDDLRTGRSGFVTGWDGVYAEILGPVSFGDSGGGLVHVPTGRALGIVSAYCAPPNSFIDHLAVGCAVFGPSVAEAMRGMARAGYPVRMRLAGEPAPTAPAATPPPPPPSAPPPSAPPPAPPSEPSPPPARDTKPVTRKKKKKRAASCKTRRQKRRKACRRGRPGR